MITKLKEMKTLIKQAIPIIEQDVRFETEANQNIRTKEIDDPCIKKDVDDMKAWLKQAKRIVK